MQILKNKRAEGYVDTAIIVLVCMMMVVLALNVFSFLTLKQDLDYFAKQMIETAAYYGRTTGEVDNRYNELADETGLTPQIAWDAEYYDSNLREVQLGDTMTVTLQYHSYIHGLGVVKIPITLTAKHSSVSRTYWKQGGI